jgi:hypothetical protein
MENEGGGGTDGMKYVRCRQWDETCARTARDLLRRFLLFSQGDIKQPEGEGPIDPYGHIERRDRSAVVEVIDPTDALPPPHRHCPSMSSNNALRLQDNKAWRGQGAIDRASGSGCWVKGCTLGGLVDDLDGYLVVQNAETTDMALQPRTQVSAAAKSGAMRTTRPAEQAARLRGSPCCRTPSQSPSSASLPGPASRHRTQPSTQPPPSPHHHPPLCTLRALGKG